MDNALATLFYPFQTGSLIIPEAGARVLFLNAKPHAALEEFPVVSVQQYFKPYAFALQERGSTVLSDIPSQEGGYDLVLSLLPKNAVEARYLIARALKAMKEGALLVCAAANDAGGKRMAKTLKGFGLDISGQETKNRARVIWCHKSTGLDMVALERALQDGAMQKVPSTGFISQPGIYGWDKIDKGSLALVESLPETMTGRGADFGCGYGFLAHHVSRNCSGVEEISCFDADFRAVTACQENLAEARIPVRFFWEDLTAPVSVSGGQEFDFIVMNPPFHEGKTTDSAIGVSFIRNAAQALRAGGTLFMVANVHLPYEEPLKSCFETVRLVGQHDGFKVFAAEK